MMPRRRIALLAVGCAAAVAAFAQGVAPKSSGQALYEENCGICHASGWAHPGFNRLTERGVPVADLAARNDLTADYVRIIVRRGLGSMPAFTPTHVTDSDLKSIADYLAHKD